MAWTAPMTAIAGSVFTAAQFNTFVRDNLAETAPAKATTPGAHFAVSGTNQIVERIPMQGGDSSTCTTTQTAFADPDSGTIGPSATVTTGSSALIYVFAAGTNSSTGTFRAGYVTTGATSIAPADNRSTGGSVTGNTVSLLTAMVHFETFLTPGVNTFTMQYRVSASTGSFSNRRIGVIPF